MTQFAALTKERPLGRQVSFVVESGVDLPTDIGDAQKRGRPLSAVTKALLAIEPGQSMFFEDEACYVEVAKKLSKFQPRRFVSRKTREGWRIWRTE